MTHYEKLANEEFPWNRDSLQSVEPVCGPCERFSPEEVRCAIKKMYQEKYLASKKDLWMAFIDLEKAFDRVPREVVRWALRTLDVDDWIVAVIKAMYMDASTMVKLNWRNGREFNVRVESIRALRLARYYSSW